MAELPSMVQHDSDEAQGLSSGYQSVRHILSKQANMLPRSGIAPPKIAE